MVTILPQKTNLGSQIGQALGGGLQQGFGQGLQRGMLKQALGKVKGLANQINPETGEKTPTDPIQLMLSLMEAGAGIPGSEKYLSTLLPALLSKARTENLYGGEGPKGAGETSMTPAAASQKAKISVEGPQPAGFLSPPMNPEQLQQYATEYANVLGTPEAFDQGLSQAQQLNEARIASRSNFENTARGMGITEQELPRYMQLATNYQNLVDPQAINRETFKKFQEIKNNKESLRNLTVPGLGRGALQKLGGLPGYILAGGKTRQDYLKNYDALVKKLVNDGEEPYVRSELATVGLSPTEIEERIHPLTPRDRNAIASLPAGNRSTPQARQNALVKFFRDNITNDKSLLVLRNYLIKDKKYDWQEVANAVRQAFPEGQNLTGYQSAELSHIARAPKDSLIDIFRGTGNALDYFRGKI